MAGMYGQDWRSAMKISTSLVDNDIVLIEIEDEVDAYTARTLDKALKDLLAQGHSRLVLDVARMHYISSTGLRAIVFAHREACGRGGQIRICGLNAQARRLFEMVGLDECLQLNDSRQEAMRGW
jgi:anti-anti-sigma factor